MGRRPLECWAKQKNWAGWQAKGIHTEGGRNGNTFWHTGRKPSPALMFEITPGGAMNQNHLAIPRKCRLATRPGGWAVSTVRLRHNLLGTHF